MATEIRVPTLGESVSEAMIGRWFKKPGDPVKADEPVVELETDKVTLEVNAPAAGTLGDIVAKDGETVTPGAVLGSIVEGGAGSQAAAPAKAAPAKSAPPAASQAPPPHHPPGPPPPRSPPPKRPPRLRCLRAATARPSAGSRPRRGSIRRTWPAP